MRHFQIRHTAVPLCLGLAVLTGCSHSSGRQPHSASSGAAAAAPDGTGERDVSVVTFTASTPASADDLRRSADRLRKRADTLGITGVRVEVKDGSIDVTGPRSAEGRLRDLAAPGRLRFRDVLAAQPSPGRTTPNSSQPGASSGQDETSAALRAKYQALDCSDGHAYTEAEQGAGPGDPIVACGLPAGTGTPSVKYLLGPAVLEDTDVASAKADQDTNQGMGWFVQLKFTAKGGVKLTDATGQLASNPAPRNQFAIVLDGRVISAPYVRESLTGGTAEIAGNFTEKVARDLAAKLNSGAIPASLRFKSSTHVTRP
ncbi:flagellar hook-length control protein FliK [Streptomyces sp. MUM 16J]|uniref:SecDF P1 head subdomain-containing protein n=1 Tax=Streptomyces sp. MUM 16J TaxID=2791988 RepID=UPI00069DBB60|nr:flagellar hook-length control protein FliK [Streptomyces sp. MUM 16J]MCH0556799.1 flagellar hook-length control protein FliK [Streptomyces sp. MUM 16J]